MPSPDGKLRVTECKTKREAPRHAYMLSHSREKVVLQKGAGPLHTSGHGVDRSSPVLAGLLPTSKSVIACGPRSPPFGAGDTDERSCRSSPGGHGAYRAR